ncbi:MAG TPA: potassium-transporting ATPase subunit KdpC [Lacunisphaera sp.]|jgi:K+-transporting ATPase ATPase C chain
MKTFFQSLRLLISMTVLTGGFYPLCVWLVGHAFFRREAEGSLLKRDGRIVGSSLLAQKISSARYFFPRPSAGDFATVPSGTSNLAWTNAKLHETIAANERGFREQNQLAPDTSLPPEVVSASGSGLDPDLSPAAVRLQIARVARARGITEKKIAALVDRSVETGRLAADHINVLKLNLALDQLR